MGAGASSGIKASVEAASDQELRAALACLEAAGRAKLGAVLVGGAKCVGEQGQELRDSVAAAAAAMEGEPLLGRDQASTSAGEAWRNFGGARLEPALAIDCALGEAP
eukprot:4952341-Prymnesium_polylepis.1